MLFVAVLIPDRHTCVICFRALSKHEGSELSSSSVERWVSTLPMTSLLNMSSLAVACADCTGMSHQKRRSHAGLRETRCSCPKESPRDKLS